MQNGRTARTGEAMSGSDPFLTLVRAYTAECVLFNADDGRPDTVWDARRRQSDASPDLDDREGKAPPCAARLSL